MSSPESPGTSMTQVAYDHVIRDGFEGALRQYTHYIVVQNDFAARERVLLGHYESALEALR